MTPATPTCRACGSPITDPSAGGECPACLLALSLTPNDAPPPEADRPPGPADLQPAFPDLEIQGLIGEGGMGYVYKARQSDLDRTVALKILKPSRAAQPEVAERFLREAKTQARMSHPNILAIHDLGRASGTYFLVMEYVEGTNLRTRLRDGRPEPAETLRIVAQVCDAMQYAHGRGVVHRDIKPENVLLDRDGHVKVADFGLVKVLGEAWSTFLDEGHRFGTPDYMPPEQWKDSARVDHRADLYALGVMFYEMLTGELPTPKFQAPSSKAGTDPRLDRVVARSLEPEPDRRYQRAAEMKSDVERIAGRSRRPRWTVVVSLTLAAVVLAVSVAARGRRERPAPGSPPAGSGGRIVAAEVGRPAIPETAIRPAESDARPEVAVVEEWSRPEELGPGINSADDDGGPAVSADGLTLLFHSSRPGGLGLTDLWQSRRGSADRPFGPPEHLPAPINSPEHDGEPALSGDGRTLVFVSHREGGPGSSDLWIAGRASADTPWGKPEVLGGPVNSESPEQMPSLTADGGTLLFHRPGGPLRGVYLCRRETPDGPFGPAVRLAMQGCPGPVLRVSLAPDGLALALVLMIPDDSFWIATRGASDDVFRGFRSLGPAANAERRATAPTLSADGRTLYFCADRRGNGDYDLLLTRLRPVSETPDR